MTKRLYFLILCLVAKSTRCAPRCWWSVLISLCSKQQTLEAHACRWIIDIYLFILFPKMTVIFVSRCGHATACCAWNLVVHRSSFALPHDANSIGSFIRDRLLRPAASLVYRLSIRSTRCNGSFVRQSSSATLHSGSSSASDGVVRSVMVDGSSQSDFRHLNSTDEFRFSHISHTPSFPSDASLRRSLSMYETVTGRRCIVHTWCLHSLHRSGLDPVPHALSTCFTLYRRVHPQ